MKFLYVTDTHLTAKGPSSRTDNYVAAIMTKFEEIAVAIKTHGVQAVFHGGDLFDKPVVSLQLTGMIARFIKSTGVPWYVVPGNHDLFGYNIKSLPQTSLGLLYQAGVVTILDRSYGPVEYTDPTTGKTLSFEGQEYHMDIDHRLPELDYFVSSSSDIKVLIPHSMLLDKEYFPDVPYTNTSSLVDKTQADFIFVGHYHDGYPVADIVHQDGRHTTVVNPGSMTRDEGSKGNLTRRPQYVVMEFEPQFSFSFQFHELLSAPDGTQIFDRSHITQKAAKDKYLQNFEQKLHDVQLTAVDVRDVLDQLILQDPTIDQAISQESRDRLVAAEQTIDDVAKQMTGYIEKPSNISITKIEIQGFQSHEDTIIDLADGLNAIIGPSDSGKSSVIRALRFALYNEPKGSDFIRQGSSSCQVVVHFSDGSSIKRSRTASSAGVYQVTDHLRNTVDLKGFSNNVPVDVPNTHQMPVIQLTKDLEMSLNIGYQLDVPFLIGESPGTRAAIIGRLTGVNLVDTAVREVGKDILGNTRDIKTYGLQLTDVLDKISQFNYLGPLEDRLTDAQVKISEVELHERYLSEYAELHEDIEHLNDLSSVIEADLHLLPDPMLLAPLVEQLDILSSEYTQMHSLSTSLSSTTLEETHLLSAIDSLPDGDELSRLLDSLEDEMEKYDRSNALQSDILSVATRETVITNLLAGLPAEDMTLRISDIESSIQSLQQLRALHSELQSNRLQINDLRKEIRVAVLAHQDATQQYDDLLQQLGVCPTCNQTIPRGHHHADPIH